VVSAVDGAWSAIGRQFKRPAGIGGRLMGRVMEVINRAPNRETIAALRIGPEDIVLELGFGPGCAIETLAEMAPRGRICGVDPSEEMLIRASRRNGRAIAEGRVRLMQGRIEDLRLEPASIDKILAVNVIYFFDENGGELDEARRLLKPGGKMAIYATDKSAMSRWRFAGPATHRLFGREDLAASIRRAGFRDDEFSIHEIEIAFGVKGLVATVSKRSR
jgi:SAM-dependent methyltransferase